MKRFLCSALLMIFMLFPNNVFAAGDITISVDSLTIEQGSSKTFTISAYNAIGDVLIESKNSNIASVSSSEWSTGMVEAGVTKTGDIVVTGKTAGTTEIILNIDGASFDEEELILSKKIVVTVLAPKSSNANLSGIKIDGVSVSKFSSDVVSYTLDNTDFDSITIDGIVEDDKATVNGLGKKSLSYGVNTFDIVVTAENGSKKTYTIKITRNDNRSTDNTLSSLTVSPNNIKFNKDKTNYNITVDNKVTEIKIDAKTNNSKASVSGLGVKKLDVYSNTFNIVVTAENGSKKTYTIVVNRKDDSGNVGKLSSVNTLESLVVEGYDIKFDKNKDTYYLDVPRNIDKINILTKSSDSKATVNVNNPEKLMLGENIITIEVTAENGTIKTYKIVVNRDDGVPRVTINDLLDTVSKTDSDVIILDIKDNNNIISKDVLEILNADDKKLIINKYIDDRLVYTWEIYGRDIKQFMDIDTLIEFYDSSNNRLNELTNNGKYLYFNNSLDTSIFNNIVLKIYTDSGYIYLYNYNNDELSNEYDELKYEDGYLKIDDINKGSYVVTDSEVNNNSGMNIILIIVIISIILLVVLLLLFIILLKKGIIKFNKNRK